MCYFPHCQDVALALWGSEETHHRQVCEAEVSGGLGHYQSLQCSGCVDLVQKVLDKPFPYISFTGIGILCPKTEPCPQFPWVTIPVLSQIKHKGFE